VKTKSDDVHPAVEFMRALYKITRGGFVELRAIANDKLSPPRRAFVKTPVEIAAFIEKYGQRDSKYGVYFGVNKREREDGTKKSIERVCSLYVDLDTEKNSWSTDEVLKRIHAIPGVLRPTACVRSGGGLHLYWFLKAPGDPVVCEGVNRLLQNVFAGDAVGNCDRILRAPGSWNTKRRPAKRVELAWCYDFDRVDIGALEAAARNAKKWIGDDGAWTDRRAIFRREMKTVVFDREAHAIDAFASLYGEAKRGMTKNLADMWQNRVRYKAPRGYIGIHEAALRHTAILYIANKDMPDKAIVDLVMREIEAVKSRDAPEEDWDMAREAATVLGMIQTWKPKWREYVNAAKREKKENGGTSRVRQLNGRVQGTPAKRRLRSA